MSELPLWPSQEFGIREVKEAYERGERAVCLVSPTGGGKTRVMSELARWANQRNALCGLFTNRKILTNQAVKTLEGMQVGHGVIAGGYKQQLLRMTQVCSFQALSSRMDDKDFQFPDFKIALVDEAHSNKGGVASSIISRMIQRGTFVVGFTATPIGVGHIYKRLIVAGTKAELRARGALVPCKVYAPDEPDMQGVKKVKVGEYEFKGASKRLMETLVFANVFDYWKKINPDGRPTIQWAPGVPESKWFVDEWKKLGVDAAHIDGETPDAERNEIFKYSKSGEIQVICSQGVMREGVDLPWLQHGILTQPCLGLSTYLQIVGRILRAYPGKEYAILQDHAGAYHRHGMSPNEDRDWQLNETNESISAAKRKAYERGEEAEPVRCPNCGGIRRAGPVCPHCGHKHQMSVRMVRMTDGTLQEVRGRANKVKHVRERIGDEREWVAVLCACGRSKGKATLKQALNWFKRKHGRMPEPGTRHLPNQDSLDWNRYVTEVYPWAAPKKRSA